MSPPRFVHLQVHSDFSMIDGIAKVKPLVKACVENNMVAMGLTDFTNFCGPVLWGGIIFRREADYRRGCAGAKRPMWRGKIPFNLIGKK